MKTNPHRLVSCHFLSHGRVILRTEKGMTEDVRVDELRLSDRYGNVTYVIDCDETGNVTDTWVKWS